MFQMWDDPRVQFEDGGRHKYLNALMHAEMVWMPDTYFIKHGEFKYPLDKFDPIHIALRIFPNGTVHYTTRSVSQTINILYINLAFDLSDAI